MRVRLVTWFLVVLVFVLHLGDFYTTFCGVTYLGVSFEGNMLVHYVLVRYGWVVYFLVKMSSVFFSLVLMVWSVDFVNKSKNVGWYELMADFALGILAVLSAVVVVVNCIVIGWF